MLLNLLLNALDALGGSGKISVRAHPAGDDAVLLCVQDDGPGLAPEIAEHLFEPFSTTKPPGQGTGLGLAVAHTIVESLGGRICAHNAEQGGACFELRLPLARPAAQAVRVAV